ncbi:PilZ domain-containing protein [Methylocystis parvus]|uniref:PilZ domain-containing protein n=1 Tax=Methylocystis parvus TaxID=134 RepID=A0A6B8M6U1_9HYPH|nr:PilZ domain-containing protein [Methylocystis parvus]QGM96540.1 PilZ domain-containing protein [Methylocystis parvus]WBJ99608.1 PilZ domain-containing protein [Methylocystis parvus OBBP]
MSPQTVYFANPPLGRILGPAVGVDIAAAISLPDGSEHAVRIVEASADELALAAPLEPLYGDHVVVYASELGRLDGDVDRLTKNGFVMTLELGEARRRRLAAQLIWFANRDRCGLVEARRHRRFVPRTPWTRVRLPGGAEQFAQIADVSIAGVRVEAAAEVSIGDRVAFGVKTAVVGRVFNGGFVAEFEEPFAEGELSEMTLL